MYQLLVYVHVVSAVIWVGGAFFVQLLAVRVSRSDDPEDLPRLSRHVEALGNWVFVPAAALLFISGLAMTTQRWWRIEELWIAVAIVLWLFSALAGAVYLAPRIKRATRLFETEGPTSPAARSLMRRMFLVSRLELLSFAVVIALMVSKPRA